MAAEDGRRAALMVGREIWCPRRRRTGRCDAVPVRRGGNGGRGKLFLVGPTETSSNKHLLDERDVF
jgi:hypothetical protein